MEERVHMRRRGLPLVAHCYGESDRPVVVLLHGFLDCGLSWSDLARELSDTYRVVAPDMRGFGHSGWVGAGGYYHFYDYYDDVLAWLQHLGVDSFAMVGHSMGGSIAAGVAAIAAQRCTALVLLEGLGPPADEPQSAVRRLATWNTALSHQRLQEDVEGRRRQRRVLANMTAAARRLRKHNPRLTEARAMRFAQWLTEPVADGVCFRHDPLHLTPAAKSFLLAEAEPIWRAITAPVLLLSGAESAMPTADLAHRFACLADARSYVVPAAGHNIHHDQPELVARATLAWLSGRASQMPSRLQEGLPKNGRPATHSAGE